MRPKILVVCTHNAVRSQMAEAYLRKFLGDQAEVYSAGLVAGGLHPMALKVMEEDGLDISKQTSKTLEDLPASGFQYVLTVCDHARENCPVFPSTAIRIHKSFHDPSNEKPGGVEEIHAFRSVRDQIKSYCESLARQILV